MMQSASVLRNALETASIRILLSGESVIDWPRLEFEDDAQIEQFLRLQEIDPKLPTDREYIGYLQQEALIYLAEVLKYRIPSEIKEAGDVRNLLRFASQHQGLKRNRIYSCMTLKVMHIIHHLLARELLFNAPLSEAQLSELLSKKVYDGIDRMRAVGVPVVEYAGGRKTRHSLVTKLLAKRETIASQIFDRTRFRVVVKTEKDLVPTLLFMVREIFPFNYVIPGQSENSLLDLFAVADEQTLTDRLRRHLLHSRAANGQLQNEFSGRSYRTINFVVDVPLRISDHLRHLVPPMDPRLGEIVFVLAEFQLMDAETAERNEKGENAHTRYKGRQEQRVRMRLEAQTVKQRRQSDK